MLRAIWRYKEGIKKATALRNVDYNEEMMLWDFKCDEDVNKWDCISDREIGGQSKATFSLNKKNSGAIFAGILSTNVSLTSNMKYSGYCAIRSQPIKGSLFSSKVIDMSEFDAFRFRVRGDGRKYFINVQSPGMVRRDDVWQYFLFPRGGPQWEDITIPFDNFFITNRGYMQDHQMSFSRQAVTTVGLLLADRTNGPFSLEIQHIKAVRILFHQPKSHLIL